METIHDVSCPSFLYIAVAICSAFVFYKYCYPRNSPPLPPGPVGLPVIGNLHQFTGSRDPLDTIKKWHQQYGPIISFRAGQRTIIVVSSYKIAHDMLDNHGAIYSSRPEFVIALKHLSRNMFMGAMPHNRKWQSRRRIMTSLLGPTMSKRYQYLQDIESKQIVHEFLTSHDFSLSFERHVTSVAFTLAYGMRLENVKRAEISEMRHILHTLMDGLENLTMGMVELFPILDHLPHFLAPWNKFWRERHNHTLNFYLRGLEYSRTEQKKLPWTWTRETTRALQHTGEMSDAEIAYFVGSMNEGAIESTPKIMRSAIKAFLLYPAVAQRAQQELDDIIGSDRLPTFEDRPRLPYFNAVIKEVLRWQPLLPLGMPHSTDTDQLYMGYRIPQGSIILQNNYEMAYNVCHEPYNFKPERWLENPDLQVFSAFGYGHRRCPGEYLANNTLFIVLSRILWAYNIRHAIRDGQTVEVDEWDIRRHFTAAPAPFEVVFELRDDTESRRRIIEQEFQSMEKDASRILQKIAPESKS